MTKENPNHKGATRGEIFDDVEAVVYLVIGRMREGTVPAVAVGALWRNSTSMIVSDHSTYQGNRGKTGGVGRQEDSPSSRQDQCHPQDEQRQLHHQQQECR